MAYATPYPVNCRTSECVLVRNGPRASRPPTFLRRGRPRHPGGDTSQGAKRAEINLKGTRVTAEGLDTLKNFKALVELNLADTRVGDAGLVRLKGLPKLEVIDLEGASVTDAGLMNLAGLPALESVQAGGTQVTRGGAEKLKKAVPKVHVSTDR